MTPQGQTKAKALGPATKELPPAGDEWPSRVGKGGVQTNIQAIYAQSDFTGKGGGIPMGIQYL